LSSHLYILTQNAERTSKNF